MRIPSGKTDQYIYFVATLGGARVTGLSGFTVYRSRNGGAATAYTTPTVAELDATNMPGVYALLIDEDTTIGSSSNSEEYAVHITKSGSMDPVSRTIELYRDLFSSTVTEIGQGAPAATATIVDMIRYLYKAWRNKKTVTATTYSLFADDASTVDQKSTLSDSSGTFTEGEKASGP